GCTKKDQSQTQPPATDNMQATQTSNAPEAGQNQMASPAQGQQQGQQQPPQEMTPAPQQQMAKAAPPPPPPPPPPLVVPAGTSIVVRMGNTIDTKTAAAGTTFTGSLAHAVAVDGEVAIPSGAGVVGSVVDSKSPGKFKGEGVLVVTLNSVEVGGVPTTIETSN